MKTTSRMLLLLILLTLPCTASGAMVTMEIYGDLSLCVGIDAPPAGRYKLADLIYDDEELGFTYTYASGDIWHIDVPSHEYEYMADAVVEWAWVVESFWRVDEYEASWSYAFERSSQIGGGWGMDYGYGGGNPALRTHMMGFCIYPEWSYGAHVDAIAYEMATTMDGHTLVNRSIGFTNLTYTMEVLEVTPAPEPSAFVLMSLGLLAVAGRYRSIKQ